MKIIFIRPGPSPETIGLQHLMVVEPLELEILATLVAGEHEVQIFDMILEKESIESILHKSNPDILCITGYITHIPVLREICLKAKNFNPDIVTITGGVHAEKFPEDLSCNEIDYIVVRNATRTFPLLVSYLCGKGTFPDGVVNHGSTIPEVSLPDYDFFVPLPDRSLTQKYRSKYFYVFHNKVALIKTSFGCPYKCNFCFCREITGGNYFERPLNEVMEELETIPEEEIYIVDDDFLLNPSRVREFIHELKIRRINKKFLVYGRADFIAAYPEIIKEFKAAGLRTIIVGLESFKDHELQGFDKRSSKDLNVKALNVMNQYKVDCYAAVIISPDWDISDFRKAGDIMEKLKIKFVNLQPLTPLKGINMNIDGARLVVDRKDFAKWDLAYVTIQPEKMSLEEFYRNILMLYDRIVLDPLNLLSHLKYSPYMLYKMVKGMYRVRNQYKQIIRESAVGSVQKVITY